MTTDERLGRYVDIIHQYGPYSRLSRRFLERHSADRKFVKLAQFARIVLRAIRE